MDSNATIMDKGIRCLLMNLGTVETETFISMINREKFDYTKWQREHFDSMDSKEFVDAAAEYDKKHPFISKKMKK